MSLLTIFRSIEPQQRQSCGLPRALVPILKYDQLREALEDAADRAALREARASGEEFFPDSLVERLWSGASRVLIWREYRGLSATELARRAKVPKIQLSAIENGDATGSVLMLRNIADALGVTIDDIVPPAG